MLPYTVATGPYTGPNGPLPRYRTKYWSTGPTGPYRVTALSTGLQALQGLTRPYWV